MELSRINGWYDEDKNIYLIFTREECQNKLNLSNKTVIKAFKELDAVELIKEVRQGLGKPNLIYIGKMKIECSEMNNLHLQKCKNYTSVSEKNTLYESENLHTINTYINNTEYNDDQIEFEKIKLNSKVDEFKNEEKELLLKVLEKIYKAKYLKVGAVNITGLKLKEKLKNVTKENLEEILQLSYQVENVNNLINYLAVCLYNCIGRGKIKREILNFKSKEVQSLNPVKNNSLNFKLQDERKYTKEFLESFYDNV